MALAEVLTSEADPWVPRDTFGARLALVRQVMGGWNVKKTADLCELDDQSWRNWESGDSSPRDYEKVCAKIAKHTGCDLRWLMAGGPLIRWNMQSAGEAPCIDPFQLLLDFDAEERRADMRTRTRELVTT